MNITAGIAVGALTVAAYLMVTEPFQHEDSTDAIVEADQRIVYGGDIAAIDLLDEIDIPEIEIKETQEKIKIPLKALKGYKNEKIQKSITCAYYQFCCDAL